MKKIENFEQVKASGEFDSLKPGGYIGVIYKAEDESDKEYLKCVSPELAIISVGENNSYHLPSGEVISLLKELDIPYSRTDLQGTIRITL